MTDPNVKAIGCGDACQGIVWLIRTDTLGEDGMVRRDVEPLRTCLTIPGLDAGRYQVTAWDTLHGRIAGESEITQPEPIELPPLTADMALAISLLTRQHRIGIDRRSLPPVLLRSEFEDREVQMRRIGLSVSGGAYVRDNIPPSKRLALF